MQTRQTPHALGEHDRAATPEGLQIDRQPGCGSPVPRDRAPVARRGAEHRDRQLGVERKASPAEGVGPFDLPGVVGVLSQNLGARDRRSAGRHDHVALEVSPRTAGRWNGQQELGPANQPELRVPAGEAPRPPVDRGDAFAARLQKALPVAGSEDALHAQPPQQRGERLVAGGLLEEHGFDVERVGQGSRRVELHPVVEDEQPNSAALHAVVAVENGVDNALEHGAGIELRRLDPAGILARGHPHVAPDELDRVPNLRIERPGDGGRIELRRLAPHVPVVPHCLDQGAGNEPVGALGAQQDAGNGSPELVGLVGGHQLQLLKPHLRLVDVPGSEEAVHEAPGEAAGPRPLHQREVGAPPTRAAAVLEQALQRLGRELADGAALAGQAAAGTLVHQGSPLHLDHEHGRPFRKAHPCRENRKRGSDSLLADVADELLEEVHPPPAQIAHGPVVGHAEHQRAAARVGERREFVRDSLRTGRRDAALVEVRLLELESAVLAQLDPMLKALGGSVRMRGHHSSARRAAITTVPRTRP